MSHSSAHINKQLWRTVIITMLVPSVNKSRSIIFPPGGGGGESNKIDNIALESKVILLGLKFSLFLKRFALKTTRS